jgi:hypothetical protein
MTTKPPISVELSARFKRDVKRLRKDYLHVREDVQAFIEQLEAGETPGDQVPGFGIRSIRCDSEIAMSRGEKAVELALSTMSKPPLLFFL